jgi:hypothetical protein
MFKCKLKVQNNRKEPLTTVCSQLGFIPIRPLSPFHHIPPPPHTQQCPPFNVTHVLNIFRNIVVISNYSNQRRPWSE